MNKKIFSVLICMVLLAVVVSAVVYEENFIKDMTTKEDVNDVNIIGFVCGDAQCSGDNILGNLWGGTIEEPAVLNTGADSNHIILEYPTKLEGTAYGIYFYKEDYIPYEVYANWAGNGKVGPYDDFLYQKPVCTALISNFQLSDSTITQGDTLTISADISSAINSAGPLQYVPPSIADHYKNFVEVTLEINNSEDETVYSYETNLSINYSENLPVEFEWTPDTPGTYDIRIKTDAAVLDGKCLNNSDENTIAEETLEVVSGACSDDNDCEEDYYSDNYCEAGNVYRDFHDFGCVDESCEESITPEQVEECKYGCEDGACRPATCEIDADCGEEERICMNDDVYMRTPICVDGFCGNFEISEDPVEECEYGCEEGVCLEEPVTCEIDTDCGEVATELICMNDNVYNKITTPICDDDTLTCDVEISYEEIEECDSSGCEDGACLNEGEEKDKDKKDSRDFYLVQQEGTAKGTKFFEELEEILPPIELGKTEEAVSDFSGYLLWLLILFIIILIVVFFYILFRI